MFRLLFCVSVMVVANAYKIYEEPKVDLNGPVTVTPLGSIRGSWMQTRSGRQFQAYRGIRYADPPVGKLRFRPPRAIYQYPEEVDASQEGPACPQPTLTPDYFVDEDCLRVNVYTPSNNSSKPLPVIVYLHPGGFYSVSGRSDVSGPRYLLERDVVFVTVNYRLATLGFLSTGDKHAPGNYGFKDQVAALRWVKRNIRAFGGDPGLVTIAGYSAGSFSIGLLMVSPMGKGLFHRAIEMSSSPISQVVIGPHQLNLAERQAKLLDCPTNTTEEMVGCLRGKPWREIANSLDSMFEFGFDPVLLWHEVLEPDIGEEIFLKEQPLSVLTSGRAYTVPTIISQTKDEFFWKAFNIINNATRLSAMNEQFDKIAPISFMLPPKDSVSIARRFKEFPEYLDGKPVMNTTASAQGLGKLYSDAIIGFAVHRMAKLMCRHSAHPVYHYQFAYVGNNSHYVDPITKKPVGAAHHDDLIYLLTIPASFPEIPLGSPDDVIVQRMTAIWYNFARFGDPNPRPDTPELSCLSWPAMQPSCSQYLKIDSEFSIHQNMFQGRYALWDELYPIQY